MRSTRTTMRRGLGAGLAVAALALAGLATNAAAAPGDDFTPTLAFSSSTTQAGDHPDLTIEMQRPYNHCLEPDPPYYYGPPYPPRVCTKLYMQQNLKRQTVHFPPGLLADANAAPYCDPQQDEWERWFCRNEDALVGTVMITAQTCDPIIAKEVQASGCWEDGIGEPFLGPPGTWAMLPGLVYNDAPRPGEQGHLVVLWPQFIDPEMHGAANQKTDISLTVRKSDAGLDAVVDNIPDYVIPSPGLKVLGQIVDLVFTLDGSTGLERGHPALTNPTFCDTQSVDVEFQGYAENSQPGPQPDPQPYMHAIPGHGDGKVVPASASYQATGCDKVPYDPKLDLRLSTNTPEAAPAISATVTQDQGEATSGHIETTFPKAFKINDKNKATFCSETDIQASLDDDNQDHCAESSRIGTVTAESPLLPIGQKLHGNVYLGGLTGDSLKVSAILKGFISLRINARGKIANDLTLKTIFDDLPATPITRFDLNLEGGDKGLIKNPRVCGPQTIASSFTSHSGKQVDGQTPVDIGGCKDPVLDVELSNPRKGKPTDLDASVSSTGTSIESVDLRLDRHLKWGTRKAAKGKRQLTQGGSATFDTLGGQKVVPLTAKATKRGGLVFGPLTTGRKGQQVATAVPGFSATLTRAQGQGARTARRDLSALFRKSALGMSGLPGDDPTGVDLNLLGQGKRRPIYLKNPLGCKKPLNFVAIVKTKRGATLALKDQVRLKGRGCPRK